MEYGILGPVEARIDGEPLDLGPKKQRSLFALLLVHRNRTVSTDRILDALWGEDAEGKERALWVYISRLRAILSEATSSDLIVTKDHGYALEIGDDPVDADVFEDHFAAGRTLLTSDPRAAVESLDAAMGVWRGSPLEDFAYEEWAREEILRLSSLRAACADTRIDALLATGAGGELISELELAVAERPYDETPVRQLMIALYRAGRHTDSLRTYERFRKHLASETGSDPSPELRLLEEQVLFHDTRLGSPSSNAASAASNPYRGLEAFREEDAAVFFGRDRLVADLLARMADQTILTVVGPSGSGKSSVVRSGLIPALRKGAIEGSDRWQIATMLPGGHPFVEVEAALLRTTLDAPDSLSAQLDGSPDELLRAARRVAASDDAVVVVVIDQFEELFTSTDPAVADRFLTAIVEAASDPRRRTRFILTLRADFYDRPLAHPAFGAAFAPGIVNVVPMAPEELEAAAAGPAQSVGVRLEPQLEAALIGDVLGEPGALPLFQFALTDLFDRRIGDTLTLETYRGMGGIHGSVSRKAEGLFARLTDSQKATTQQVFLRLVTVTDTTEYARRRIEASELLSLPLDPDDIRVVLSAFGAERLLSFDRSPVTGSPTVEVAHEALLSHWARLQGWIEEARTDLERNARLTTLAAEWDESGRNPGFLLTGDRLATYAEWSHTSVVDLAATEQAFIEASVAERSANEAVEAERVAREASTKRRARWSAAALAVLALVVLGAVVAGTWAVTRPAGPSVALVHGEETDSISLNVREGFALASRELPIEGTQVLVQADFAERIRQLAEDGTELIIASIDYASFIYEVAPDYPGTRFVVLDSGAGPTANIATTVFNDQGGAYLMGLAAAHTTKTKVVGVQLAAQFGWTQLFVLGFEAGVHAVDPSIQVLTTFSTPQLERNERWGVFTPGFGDEELAYNAATRLFEQKADVVLSISGEAQSGVMRAAADFSRENGEHVWGIGVDVDEGFSSPPHIQPHVLTSLVKRFDVAVYQIVELFLAGELTGEIPMTFTNNAVEWSDFGGFTTGFDAELRAAAINIDIGNIDLFAPVPSTVTIASDSVDEVTLAWDGNSCELSRRPRAEIGEPVTIIIRNDTEAPAVFGMGVFPTHTSSSIPPQAERQRAGITWAGDQVEGMGGFLGQSWGVLPGDSSVMQIALPEEDLATGALVCWAWEIPLRFFFTDYFDAL